ncbi:MAG: GntR family transcriptional regulator [Aurantimonas sp.]|nr:GntR family transcriptional regulator [Aurantimonas sp.]MAQ45483.1 GntR family transcriptional regulator [Actibacterium sp.]MAQ45508.1 GntR family transcriptional regulator [Actibacterium sp.]MAQ45533.1 GntR family transcriptional regulator [Actibacterium sp.]
MENGQAPDRRTPGHTVRLKDVAARAGCSIATASRVLNGNAKVGASDRERVLAAAAQLGYVPNSSARALRSQSTRLVGAIIPTLDHAIYAKMVDGLQEQLSAMGMSLIINTSDYDLEREKVQARVLVGRGVESVVLVGTEHSPETTQLFRDAGIRQVYTYTSTADGGDAAVGFDNFRAGQMVAEYLVGLGHARVAMIAGVTKGNDRATQRRDGFLHGLEGAGICQSDVLVLEAPYRIESGYHAMQSAMQTHPRPTAVFCGSDIIAAGASNYCRTNEIPIPAEVSIVGFDDLEIAELVSPPLTTVNVPAKQMGIMAGKALSGDSKPVKSLIVHEMQTRLIVRGSTGQAST